MSEAEPPASPENKHIRIFKLGETIRPFRSLLRAGTLSTRSFEDMAQSEIAVEVDEELLPLNFTVYARKQQVTTGTGRQLWIVANKEQLINLGDVVGDSYDQTGESNVFIFRDQNAKVLGNLLVKVPFLHGAGIMMPDRKKFKNGRVVFASYRMPDDPARGENPLLIAPLDDDQLSAVGLSFHLAESFRSTAVPAAIADPFEPRPIQEALSILRSKGF